MFENLRFIQENDSADPTFLEVLLAYNGYHAICWHRMNHAIWTHLKLRALARFSANVCRIFTGIEIHPEAKIGKNFYIDHGTGAVIGQTAISGDEVTIFHGVTLGGVGRDGESGKRHPTVKDRAMIGSGAQVLGNITIGEGAKIGSNSVVLHDVPDGKTALGIPARVVGGDGKARAYGLPSLKETENITFTIDCILREMGEIKRELDMPSLPECDKVKPKKKVTKKRSAKKKAVQK
jgi:serine O-acetyltransferase